MTKLFGSIRDVAKESGLSTATVSRVMNGALNVSPVTRERVLRACAKLHYVPNPAARALTTQKSRTVAAIIPSIEHSVFAKYIAGIEQTLAQRGYSLVLAISNGKAEEELAAARKLIGMGADAFILTGADHSDELLDMLDRRALPTVFTSVRDAGPDRITIGYDNAALAADAVAFLAGKGHLNLAVLHGPLAESDRTRARREGAIFSDVEGLRTTLFETELSVAGGKESLQAILSMKDRPTAILCFSDVIALGVYFGLAEAGLRAPADMSVMGFDNLDWSEDAQPALTTIDLPAESMGREAAARIIDYLEDGIPLRSNLLTCQIVERASVINLK